MKNAAHLKAVIKNFAKEKKISAQFVLQNYVLERFLERVSLSEYRNNFIIKGGFLIGSMVGLDSRTTMDMDVTVKNYPLNEDSVIEVIENIIEINLADDFRFEIIRIVEIRDSDEYNGYRVALTANYPPMKIPFKLDITTGDRITPREIEYEYKLMLEERSIGVLAYNPATILAEKLETVISRGDQNTRLRDYYDIYILTKMQIDNIDVNILKTALEATTNKRGSISIVKQYREIMNVVKISEDMNRQWNNYRRDFDYASNVEFNETCDAVIRIMDGLSA